MKQIIRRLTPRFVLSLYHFAMAWLAALVYRFPSRKMIVVGITGTKGKSTTSLMVARVLEKAGYKVGLASTALFKLGEREWLNPYKMTMLGRFKLQKLLRQMVDEGCRYAIVEVSSEGLKQHRHQGINFDIAIFTNLSPEHIEAHGSFEAYRTAKGKLFARLCPHAWTRKVIDGKEVQKVLIVNLDNEHTPFYLQFKADEKIGFTMSDTHPPKGVERVVAARSISFNDVGSTFEVDGTMFRLSLLGAPNVENALAAIAVATAEHIPMGVVANAMSMIRNVPGRFERLELGQDFEIIVDYAHTADSFVRMYETLEMIPHRRIIHVFGGTGGGRDKEKRADMGRIAAEHADRVILTTDDPYEEDPGVIAAMIQHAMTNDIATTIIDRRAAIHEALLCADEQDIVLITGKGCEQRMAIKSGTIPWDDRTVVREEWNNIKNA